MKKIGVRIVTIVDIKANCKELHTSRARRYVSRKLLDGIAEEYSGRFGRGYRVYTPAFDSTRYCYVTYFVFC